MMYPSLKKFLTSVLMVAVLSVGVLSISHATPVQATSSEQVLDSKPISLEQGQPDNDHTPVYGPDGQLLYPIYYQQRPFLAGALAKTGDDLSCGLPRPVADGRYGDVLRTDNWSRVAVEACEGRLIGVAWSAWPGRDPIHTGHEQQDLWVKAEVIDLTTGEIVDSLDLNLRNNPREQGMLFYVYEFEMPSDGHQYRLWMWTNMRQHRCGNGSGETEAEIEAVAPLPEREAIAGLLKVDGDKQPLAGATFELRNLPEFVRVTEASLISDADGKVWARVHWSGGPDQVEGEFCEIQAPAGYTLPDERCVPVQFVSGRLGFPDDPIRFVNVLSAVPACENLELSIPTGSEIPEDGTTVDVVVHAVNGELYRLVRQDDDDWVVIAGPQTGNQFEEILVLPNVLYQVQMRSSGSEWTTAGCEFKYRSALSPAGAASCVLTTNQTAEGHTMVNLGAIDEAGRRVPIDAWRAESNLGFAYNPRSSPDLLPVPVKFPRDSGAYWVQFMVLLDKNWLGGQACRIDHRVRARDKAAQGQYQGFVGAVAFGTFTPNLEPDKEYFDGTRSLMYNVEYINDERQGDIVFRFNGQEVSGVTSSIFNAGTFRQIESTDGRAITTLSEGVTKLISYHYGVEQARIFQAMPPEVVGWVHPLDQPFEHKYGFDLEIHGSPGVTDMLIYNDYQRDIHYDDNGRAVVHLNFTEPGLVAIYQNAHAPKDINWVTVDLITFPITTSQTIHYSFNEVGLYHYRIVDNLDQVVAGPHSSPHLEFIAYAGIAYQAQLVYPKTSLFVGLYDDMKFEHPPYWVMPVDAETEHVFEFHLDYDRNTQGDVVVDQLYLLNAGISAAQAFPYGRHDAVLPGVKIVGIPDVNMVAFCQPSGVHAVAYWGDWEGGSYTLPERYVIFDQDLYNEWSEGQRDDCFDAAHRVNMVLARQGLRTDYTYRHHGERSQGYQMSQQHIWSPYNLVGMRPPHVGRILKPGTVLPYYTASEDLLFWGWDLEKADLADGLGAAELQQYIEALGPTEYVDQTGLHPPGA